MCLVAGRDTVHHHGAEALGLRNRTVLVGEQHGFEVDDLLTQLSDSRRERIILGREQFHLRLQVGKPLLLALSTFESRDSDPC